MSGARQDFITDAEVFLQTNLLAGQDFQGVTVLTNANGDLLAKIDEAIAGLTLFLVITLKGGDVPWHGDSEPWEFTIMITENALLNRGQAEWDGKTARYLAQKVIKTARDSAICDLKKCQEYPGQDGMVLWEITGTIQIALPMDD